MSAASPHAGAAASGGLAAAICMAVCQIVFLGIGDGPSAALALGASLASIAFGFTYAAVFFVTRSRRGRAVAPAQV